MRHDTALAKASALQAQVEYQGKRIEYLIERAQPEEELQEEEVQQPPVPLASWRVFLLVSLPQDAIPYPFALLLVPCLPFLRLQQL